MSGGKFAILAAVEGADGCEALGHASRQARRRAQRFRQREITRALKAAKAAGVEANIEIDLDGTLRIVPAKPGISPSCNEWDEVLDKPKTKIRLAVSR